MMLKTTTFPGLKGKHIVLSDDVKRKVRAVLSNERVYYCGNDIAACLGFRAPRDVVSKVSPEKLKLPIPWVNAQNRRGIAHMICFPKKTAIDFAVQNGENMEFAKWFMREAIPEAESMVKKAEKPIVVKIEPYEPNAATNILKRFDAIILECSIMKREIQGA